MLAFSQDRAYTIFVAAKSAAGISNLIVSEAHKAPLLAFFCVCVMADHLDGSSERRFLGYGIANFLWSATWGLATLGGGNKPLSKELPMCKLVPVNFHGNTLYTAQKDNEVYVTLRSLCDALELSVQRQYKKIEEQKRKFACTRMCIRGDDDRPRPMVFIPIRRIDTWLFSINPLKIKDPIKRAKLEQYQDECSEVLYRHWHGNTELKPKKTMLEETLEKLNLIQSIASLIPADKIRDRFVDYTDLNTHLIKLAILEEREGRA